MASDGLANKAKHGKCRMCYRTRKTEHLPLKTGNGYAQIAVRCMTGI